MADQPHPLPSLALRVPSIYDKTLLETRIYVPHELQSVVQRIAVVAHPYATLGGNFNDHVVLNTVRILLGGGWVIGTFNFRYSLLRHISVKELI
ncbi:hypothetical protein BDZ91DRAFT_692653 [Kalaharituber pfeilii]|nr:hypothetical protein BDZ91DRAFT_692653 [Kalaharituber pfeilii]